MDKASKVSKLLPSSSTKMASSESAASSTKLISVDFEVFGKVQGVFFRKYTKAKGSTLGVRGWCQNTSEGTVVGQIQGSPEKVKEMKQWLKKEGSPKSRIADCKFGNEQTITSWTFRDFDIRK